VTETLIVNALVDGKAADIFVADGIIAGISDAGSSPAGGEAAFDAGGRAVLPGFVDCHTHACFAGSRLDEWERKLAGASYLELMEAGGGIMATVRATRKASETELAELLLA